MITNMKPITREIIIIVVCLFLGYLSSRLILSHVPPKGKYVDCSISEISPDFTPEMREKCRQARNADSK